MTKNTKQTNRQTELSRKIVNKEGISQSWNRNPSAMEGENRLKETTQKSCNLFAV